jgi:FtsH-binding integral membrane protein
MDVSAYSQQVFDRAEQQTIVAEFMRKVYGWMAVGLALTGVIGYVLGESLAFREFLIENTWFMWVVFGAQLLTVLGLSAVAMKLPAVVAGIGFLFYAALTGVFMALIFMLYTLGSVAATFFVTAGTFAACSIYGMLTKRDLSSMGGILMMLLFGLIIASVVNWFVASSTLYWICTYAGVIIFCLLTAYDTNKLKKIALMPDAEVVQGGVITAGRANEVRSRVAVLGALSLYLDFINLFLFMIRIMGSRK